jgi:hypothetical protein
MTAPAGFYVPNAPSRYSAKDLTREARSHVPRGVKYLGWCLEISERDRARLVVVSLPPDGPVTYTTVAI